MLVARVLGLCLAHVLASRMKIPIQWSTRLPDLLWTRHKLAGGVPRISHEAFTSVASDLTQPMPFVRPRGHLNFVDQADFVNTERITKSAKHAFGLSQNVCST